MKQSEPPITQSSLAVEEKLTTIYALVDPRDGKPFYVGKSDDEIDRCRKHVTAARLWQKWVDAGADQTRRPWTTNNPEKCTRIMSIISAGFKVHVRVLERCPRSNWREREAWWEKGMNRTGIALVNSAQCGAGGDSTSEQTRRAISRALKTSEAARIHNESRRGIPLTEGHREKVRIGQLSSERFRAARAAKRGVKRSPEAIEKCRIAQMTSEKARAARAALKGSKRPFIAALHRGVKEAPETKAAISAGLRASEKFKQAMAERRGKTFSPEHRAALTASCRVFHAMVKELQSEGHSRKAAMAIVRQRRGARPSRN